ncbi:MAG: SPOR domain-containing protein [Proteobacteria bacterium]|nr:SPOR domain-containing protein [Pseudomonadota bacterium]
MEPALKNRLIGAAVLSALAIIFLPKLIVGKDTNPLASQVPLKVPSAPTGAFETKELPLVTPAPSVPAGGVVGMQTGHPASPSASPPSSTASSAASPSASSSSSTASSAASPAASSATSSLQAATASSASSPSSSATASTAAMASPVASGKTPASAAVASAASPAAASPAQPSAPIPAAQAGGKYVVSLGTYANAGNAHALVASLQAKGLPAYADAVSVAGKSATRVRIGPFQQRGDAEAARLKAQQIRTDMPANVVALDAATPAPPEPAPAPAKGSATAPAASAKNPAAAASVASDKPAAPSPAAAARGYAVQVVAFAVESQANALRDKLRAAGFVAYSEKVTTESGVRWRVRAGPEADRAGADKLRADLAAKMKLDGVVVAYP